MSAKNTWLAKKEIDIEVSSNSMTFEPLGEGRHAGQVVCPACNRVQKVVEIKMNNRIGRAEVFEPCAHNFGVHALGNYRFGINFRWTQVEGV